MNTSCESTSTLELREFSLATSAAIGRCWQSTDWPTTKFVTGFCVSLVFPCPLLLQTAFASAKALRPYSRTRIHF